VWKVPLQILPIEGYPIDLAGLFAVIAYGVITPTRIVVRNVGSDRHKANLDKIQVYFMKTTQLPKDNNSSIIKILKSLPYNPYESQEDRRAKWKKPWSVGTDGLVHIVALINSIIFAILCIIVSIIAVGSSRPITNQEELTALL
jgi:hypothetical protein